MASEKNKRKLVILILAILLIGCSAYSYKQLEKDGKVYKCVDLENGIYKDAKGKRYRISYDINNGELNFFLSEVK